MNDRDNFSKPIANVLAKRASFICSNPNCRCLTLCPSDADDNKYISTGVAAHITAASDGGPRHNVSLTVEQRVSLENAIFLCASCATMIDKNNGADYSVSLLKKWKYEHEAWVKKHLISLLRSLNLRRLPL